jgi:hypothetical protein
MMSLNLSYKKFNSKVNNVKRLLKFCFDGFFSQTRRPTEIT